MTSDGRTLPRRPRWYAAFIVGAIIVLALLGAAAWYVDDDVADTVLGLVTGMTVGSVAVVTWAAFLRKRMARRRDAAALDDLEPLRAAGAADRCASTDTGPSDR